MRRHQRKGHGSHSGLCDVSFSVRCRHSRHAFRASVESGKLLESSASSDERSSYVKQPQDTHVCFMEGLRRERERKETLTGQCRKIRRLRAASQTLKLLETLGETPKSCIRRRPSAGGQRPDNRGERKQAVSRDRFPRRRRDCGDTSTGSRGNESGRGDRRRRRGIDQRRERGIPAKKVPTAKLIRDDRESTECRLRASTPLGAKSTDLRVNTPIKSC